MNKTSSFEEDLAELEQILRQLEDGTTTLEDSLAQYARGVALWKSCYERLRDAEQRILALTGVDEEGNPKLEPFHHSSAGAPSEAGSSENSTRRSSTRNHRSDEPSNGNDGSIPF